MSAERVFYRSADLNFCWYFKISHFPLAGYRVG
jgi:hypothetical protein